MGFYPDCPATDYYTIGYPLFDKITIKLNTDYYKSDSITIEKQSKVNNTQIYFNGSEIENYRLYHNLIVEGGTLLFK